MDLQLEDKDLNLHRDGDAVASPKSGESVGEQQGAGVTVFAVKPKTVTRADLFASVYKACLGLSHSEAREILNLTIDEITDALARGEPVSLRGFGVFTVRSKKERIGRNPRTGDQAAITARRVATFKASPRLTSRANERSGD